MVKEEDIVPEYQGTEEIYDKKPENYEILVVDGCQYILYIENRRTTREYRYIAHKGNCNNPIHSYRIPDIIPDTLESKETITKTDKDKLQ